MSIPFRTFLQAFFCSCSRKDITEIQKIPVGQVFFQKALDKSLEMWYDKRVPDGALAQLGAHNTGSVGVRGSNPLRSTSRRDLLCSPMAECSTKPYHPWAFGYIPERLTENPAQKRGIFPFLRSVLPILIPSTGGFRSYAIQ